MRNSIVATVLSVIILFISLIVLPTYFIGIVNWRTDMNTCQTAARNYIDMVIDNGCANEKAISDLNLSLAACSSTFTYEVIKEKRVVNPDTSSSYKTEWVAVPVDPTGTTKYDSGDLVTIVITQRSMNQFQRISMVLLGTAYSNMEIRLTGMVR